MCIRDRSDNGGVTRGICKMDNQGNLTEVVETKNIVKTANGAEADDVVIDTGSLVSMNMWGFSNSILKELKERFKPFLDDAIKNNPMKGEYFLPFVVDELLQEHKATVKVLKSEDKWYGVTYKEDKPMVMAAVQNLKDQGLYPQNLWEEA